MISTHIVKSKETNGITTTHRLYQLKARIKLHRLCVCVDLQNVCCYE
jgi:hypothetical protein